MPRDDSHALKNIMLLAAWIACTLFACTHEGDEPATDWVQVGSMRETIGQQQHQGRLALEELQSEPHLYGVGALAGLQGEITLIDSQAVVSSVSEDGVARAAAADGQATMFVGQRVASWNSVELAEAVRPDDFDATVKARAEQLGLDLGTPIVFLAEAEFTEVRLHVLNGACPVHARMRDEPILDALRPFEWSGASLRGTLVGIYAEDAVGKLTHPATSVHAHLVYVDPSSGERLTAHVEQTGAAKGAVFKFPASGS